MWLFRDDVIDRQLGCLSKNDDLDGCSRIVDISVTRNDSITVKKFFQTEKYRMHCMETWSSTNRKDSGGIFATYRMTSLWLAGQCHIQKPRNEPGSRILVVAIQRT